MCLNALARATRLRAGFGEAPPASMRSRGKSSGLSPFPLLFECHKRPERAVGERLFQCSLFFKNKFQLNSAWKRQGARLRHGRARRLRPAFPNRNETKETPAGAQPRPPRLWGWIPAETFLPLPLTSSIPELLLFFFFSQVHFFLILLFSVCGRRDSPRAANGRFLLNAASK